MLAATVPVALNLGGEFIPKLDEGDLVLDLTRPPDASLSEAASDTTRLEKALLACLPRRDPLRRAVSRVGPRSGSTLRRSTRPSATST